MKIQIFPIALLIALLILNAECLHLKVSGAKHQEGTDSQQQLNYLINLQNKYTSDIKTITANAATLRKRVQQTSSIEQQIAILQGAVKSQRQNIGSLANELTLDPESGLTQCTVLPADKQTKLNDDANMIQWRITELEALVNGVPHCDQITAIRQEIQKMKTRLAYVQKVSSSPCENNLIKVPAIYQTNLFQNNDWVLGNMTMQELIEQYYQRSLKQANITNCPMDRPFLASSTTTTTADKCIKCPLKTPYFDISAKICISCPADQSIDYTIRKCGYPAKNSNYDSGINYQLDPLRQLPLHRPSLAFCPADTPFFNGTICISCPRPTNYWQVSQSKCYKCPIYFVFNNTSRVCQKNPPLYVYGNRQKLLATNKTSISDYNNTLAQAIAKNTSRPPTECQDPTKYAAITHCVSCDTAQGYYFNVQTLACSFCDGVPDVITNKCSQRKYYFFNPKAQNLLISSNQTLEDISNKNQQTVQSNPVKYGICPESDPFPSTDKLSCGKCNADAPLFSVQLQGCTFCPSSQQYDPQMRQCRTITYLTNYDQNVIITPPTTLQSLLAAEAQVNKTRLTKKCPISAPYTPDGKLCLNCSDVAPYFDLNHELCMTCTYPQTYSIQKKGCYKINYLTNLSAPNLLEVSNYTITNVAIQQNQTKSDKTKVYKQCPADKPYGLADQCVMCIEVGAVFNLHTLSCQFCPPHTVYNSTHRQCVTVYNVTNINAGRTNIIQTEINTLAGYTSEMQTIKKSNPTSICPATQPYVVNNICQACQDPTPFFSLSTRKCVACDNFISTNNTCPPKLTRYSNLTNYFWITSTGTADGVVNKNWNLKSLATGTMCPAFYNQKTKNCVICPENTYFNFDNGQCVRCESDTIFNPNLHKCFTSLAVGSYYTDLDSSPNELQLYGGLTLDQIKTIQLQEKKKYPNAQYCPSIAPFYDNIQCIRCPSYKKYFNLRYKECQVCLQNEKLDQNDCINIQGNKVWQEPAVENLYKYIFSQL